MIQLPKMPLSTKLILGFLCLLFVFLGVLWITKENRLTWVDDFIQSNLLPKPSATPPVVLTLRPTAPAFPDGTPLVTAIGMTSIYSGPGEDFEVIALLEPGKQAMVEGMSEDEAWWAINVPYLASGRGWVLGERVLAENTLAVRVISGDDLSGSGAGETVKGKALTNVNIRSGPGLNFQKVGTLEIDQEAEIIGIGPDKFWYFIEIPGISDDQGWVSVDYLSVQNADNLPTLRYQPANANRDVPTPAADKPALTAAAVLNIRSGPETSFEILGKMEVGQRAELLGVSADGRWYAIKYTPADTGRAWVAADYVEVEKSENLPVLP